MNNQSYLLSERASARVSFGSESSRLSSLGHLQSTEQSPFAATTRASVRGAEGAGGPVGRGLGEGYGGPCIGCPEGSGESKHIKNLV